MIDLNSKIYIAGHTGMVGSACWKMFKQKGYKNLIGKSSSELDLRNYNEVMKFLNQERPDVVIICAAKVGGILANNSYPYEFLMDNMIIQNNIIRLSFSLKIKKLVFLGSSCIYPKFSKQPIKEEYLLTDSLEPTNQWYALAKITGVKLIEALNKQYGFNYVSLMPTNLYGPGDNFDLETSHVLPALIRKFSDAKKNNKKQVKLWGTGSPLREFLHVNDLARAIIFFVESDNHDGRLFNIGSGEEISIKSLANKIKNIIGFEGDIIWDRTKPDGTPRKLIDSSKSNELGWKHEIKLEEGLKKTIEYYEKNYN